MYKVRRMEVEEGVLSWMQRHSIQGVATLAVGMEPLSTNVSGNREKNARFGRALSRFSLLM